MTHYFPKLEKEFQRISDHTGLNISELEPIFGGAFDDKVDLLDIAKRNLAEAEFLMMLNVQAASEFGQNMPQPNKNDLVRSVKNLFDTYIFEEL